MGIFKRRKGKKRRRGLRGIGRKLKKATRGVSRAAKKAGRLGKRIVRSKAVGAIGTAVATGIGGPAGGSAFQQGLKTARRGIDIAESANDRRLASRAVKRARKAAEKVVSRHGIESVRAAGNAVRTVRAAEQAISQYGNRVPHAHQALQSVRDGVRRLSGPAGRQMGAALRSLKWR